MRATVVAVGFSLGLRGGSRFCLLPTGRPPPTSVLGFAFPRHAAHTRLREACERTGGGAEHAALVARGDDVLRISGVSKVAALGLTHVSKVKLAQWSQLHMLAGTRGVILLEDPADVDDETRVAVEAAATVVTCVHIG